MIKTTVGQVLVNRHLPPELRDWGRVLDKEGIEALFQEIAERHPDRYRDVSRQLSDVGHDVAYQTGGFSFGLHDMQPSGVARAARAEIEHEVRLIHSRPGLDDAARERAIVATLEKHQHPLESAIFNEASARENPLAQQIRSGARGKPMNLKSLLGADLLYTDHHDRAIPVPVLNSYPHGLSPVEYWAGAFGARKGVADTKFCLWAKTEVLMADFSVRKVEDIEPGDMVFTVDDVGYLAPTRVVHRYDNGFRHCRTFRFRNGRARAFVEVTATSDHRVYAEWRTRQGSLHGPVARGMIPLGECDLGRRSAVVHRGIIEGVGVDEPRSGLLGLLAGDGGLTQHNTNFYSSDPQRTARVEIEAAPFGLVVVPNDPDDPASISYRLQEAKPSSGIGGGHKTPFRAWLAALGYLGLAAHEKFVPAAVWTWNRRSCGRFLAWLFETDGCFTVSRNQRGGTYPIVSIYVTAERLAADARRLLRDKLGIYAGPLKRRAEKGKRSRFVDPTGKVRWATRNHDLHGFTIGCVDDVRRVAAFWHGTGAKSAVFQVAVANHVASYSETLIRRGAGAVDAGILPTHDLEVDHPSSRFVLANGLIVSNSTQEAGFFAKQLAQVAHRLVVTGLDDEDAPDRHAARGLPVAADDPDNVGALLAHPVGPYGRNTQITPRVFKDLKARGIARILVRSPTVGGPPLGGVYARDVGVRERGHLPLPNDFVGIAAAQALSEKLTQGQLGSKHSGGVAGADKSVTGFKFVNQLVQIPKTFRGGATHAQRDGVVSSVREAPQGGHYVAVGGDDHYVPHDRAVLVQPGDKVEAGDVLSEGTPNPADIVRHKGIGEGRRHFVDAFRNAYRRSGMGVDRRNVELLSRGLIDHVRVTEEFGDHIEDDIVPYSHVERYWEPREGHQVVSPSSAVGKYLERPVLHHTIGVKIKPSMLPEFAEFGVKNLTIHPDPPPFEPVMIRGMATLASDPDWMTRHLGSGLQHSTLEAVHRGATSDEAGTSYVPALAQRVDFGRQGLTRGWQPRDGDADGRVYDGTPRERPASSGTKPRHL